MSELKVWFVTAYNDDNSMCYAAIAEAVSEEEAKALTKYHGFYVELLPYAPVGTEPAIIKEEF